MRTILVLEDDPQMLKLYRLLLPSTKCRVLEASSAEDAYLCAEDADGCLDALVADVNPNIPGIRVALALRSLRPNLQVFLTSAFPPDRYPDGGIENVNRLAPEATKFIQKPFDIVGLAAAVHKAIGLEATQCEYVNVNSLSTSASDKMQLSESSRAGKKQQPRRWHAKSLVAGA